MLELLGTLLFHFTDPVGDARGNGGYIFPTHPNISMAAVDLRKFEVREVDQKLRFVVVLGAIENPWDLPSGYSSGVTDIFVKTRQGKRRQLANLNLQVKGSGGWEYHVRVTGAGATLHHMSNQGRNKRQWKKPTVQIKGSSLIIDTNIPSGEYAYWVTNSLYSPLSPNGFMPHGTRISTTSLQIADRSWPLPVDVLAGADDNSAYQSNTLAPVGEANDWRAWTLFAGGLLGLLIALVATFRLWRRRK